MRIDFSLVQLGEGSNKCAVQESIPREQVADKSPVVGPKVRSKFFAHLARWISAAVGLARIAPTVELFPTCGQFHGDSCSMVQVWARTALGPEN